MDKLQILKDALLEILENKDMCIAGTPELLDAPREVVNAFRNGSAMAFERVCRIAEKALGECQDD